MLAAVAIFLAAAPAGAMAETTETTVPAAESPPSSTGWVPQGGVSEGAGGESAGAQQGSSLGSGGSSAHPTPKPAAPPSAPPVASAPEPAPEPSEPSNGSYETEASAEPAAEEPVAAPTPDPEPAPAKPAPDPPSRVDHAPVGLGEADAVLTGSGGVKGVSASSATAAATPDSGGLPWLALIVFGLILVFAGARLVYGPIEADSLRYSRFRIVRRAAPRG